MLSQSTSSACKYFRRAAAHLGQASIDTTRKGYAQLDVDDLKADLESW